MSLARPLGILLLTILSFGGIRFASAQVLSVTTEPGLPVVRIDVESGARQPLVVTGLTQATSGLNTFDPVQRRLFLLRGAIGTQELVIVDLNLRTIAFRSIALAPPFGYTFFEWDPSTGRVLALTNQPGLPVVSIDPATGAVQQLLTTGAGDANGGINAYDPATRRLFFLTGGNNAQNIVTVHLNTSSVTQSAIADPASYTHFEYDPATARVLSVRNGPGYPLVSIDPATGNVQTLVLTNATSAHPALAAIDGEARRYYFLSGSIGSQQLMRVNLTTLSVSSVSIAMPQDAYIFFEQDMHLPAIPLADEKGLLILSLALTAIGVWAVRRTGTR